MGRLAAFGLATAVLFIARDAGASTIVFDPAPLSGTRSSDLPETGPGVNERYQFAGTARNDSSTSVHLTLSARANGSDVPNSGQVFLIPALTTTQFSYDFTLAGMPAPSQVGLTFSADANLAFVAGTFTFTHAPPSVPAGPWPSTAALVAALLVTGLGRRPASRG